MSQLSRCDTACHDYGRHQVGDPGAVDRALTRESHAAKAPSSDRS